MSSIERLEAELDSLLGRLNDAISENDYDKVKYLEERIGRVENEISNKKYFQSRNE